MTLDVSDDGLFRNSFENALDYIRKESSDIFNRLHSIEEDILFVDQIHKTYPSSPLLPNLRCGAWYTDPGIATLIPAYFKSTDGHTNNWNFNLRRANLSLLPLIIERHSIILVDSTRSGKRIPDALSKTVPIWCAVINRAMLIRHPSLRAEENQAKWDTALYTPPTTVSRQEHYQIEQRLDGWAADLANSSFSLPVLPCPLRPIWITPATSVFPVFSSTQDEQSDFFPIICVSASKQVEQGLERRTGGFSYIQGSGDDHELWGLGLTPEMFWTNRSRLINAQRADISQLVREIIHSQQSVNTIQNTATPVLRVKGRLLLASKKEVLTSPNESNTVSIILSPSKEEIPSSETCIYLPMISGKRGQAHFVQTILPRSMNIISAFLQQGKNVCVACDSGKDSSVGVVLAALQLYFTDDGVYTPSAWANTRDKQTIRTRLQWIIESRPEANPSRLVLKRVNEFLLTPTGFREKASMPDI